MTIRKNEDFGTSIRHPLNLIELQDDRAIAHRYMQNSDDVVEDIDEVGNKPSFTVTHGSIAQALGIAHKRVKKTDSQTTVSHQHDMTQVSIDLIKIEFRTSINQSVNHKEFAAGSVVFQRTSLSTAFLIISNSGIVNGRDVFPRAHPNDGFLDVLVIDSEISMRQRLIAWKKSKIGVHLPHPQLHVSRDTQYEWAGHPSRMVVDGATFHNVNWARLTVVKDAFAICF